MNKLYNSIKKVMDRIPNHDVDEFSPAKYPYEEICKQLWKIMESDSRNSSKIVEEIARDKGYQSAADIFRYMGHFSEKGK